MSRAQTERVRSWLELHGELRTHEWASAPAPDGGAPILRVGARVKELRDSGLKVATVETRPSALYRLEVSSGSPTTGTAVVPATGAAGAGFGEPAAPETVAELVEFRGPDAMLAAFIDVDGEDWWAA